ncbi:Hypothetical protein FKW44_016292 [Caligus rogercresseyi]|uniref:Uncharacterized protein n=1 Tax=Caligus rogercresseyi TaxID=217165 RepID=A0A7T8K0C3_CALRO|nr:Hypothetical protein FKW44_016292 [Caligus rogercresseyi]
MSPRALCQQPRCGKQGSVPSLLRQLGIATTQTLAVASTFRHFGALRDFTRRGCNQNLPDDTSNYPILANRRMALNLHHKIRGRLSVPKALTQHKALAKITGKAIGCVRIVTAMDTAEPRAVYSVWKIPSANAMSDNFWQDGSMLADLDLETGKVKACRMGKGLDPQTSPTTRNQAKPSSVQTCLIASPRLIWRAKPTRFSPNSAFVDGILQ